MNMMPCTPDGQCAAGFWCNPGINQCTPTKANGSCFEDVECGSLSCVGATDTPGQCEPEFDLACALQFP